jgi:hypothetical protein
MDILGEGFNQVILDQIGVRQKLYAAGYNSNNPRTPELITYATSDTSFVQLMSSVEIADPKKLNSPFVATLNETGQNLAKKAILFGGVKGLKSGIPTGKPTVFNNYAYGWGAGEFGLRPMPGITTANIKTENIGSLKTATVNIKCWDRAQFEIIETLYLRLGFYVLLEWGHTFYANNKGDVIKDPISLESEFFNKKNSIDSMLSLIVKKRLEGFGNYDALFGKVVNFSWNFNNDGSYDIVITIRSVGDIIESLKVNVFTSDTDATVPTDSAVEAYKKETSTFIDGLFRNIKAITNPGLLAIEYAAGEAIVGENIEANTLQPEAFKSNINFRLYSLKNELNNRVTKDIQRNTDNVYSIPTYLSDNKLRDIVKVNWKDSTPNYYVRFGALLRIIQGDVIPTINDIKAIKIDYDVDSNLINYLDYQISTNPKYVLIKKEIPDLDVQVLDEKCADFIESIDGVSEYGKLMNVYLNYTFIETKLDELRITPGSKVLLIDFLQALGKTISDSLGGINNIVPIIDEETNVIKFIDQNLLYKKNSVIDKFNERYKTQTSTTPGKFEIYGYNPNGSGSAGFITDMTMKTELTPQFASMITIGAAARAKVVGEDATALSRINSGLTSSYIEKYEDPKIVPTTATSSFLDQYKLASQRYVEFVQSMNMADNNNPPQWNEDNFSTYQSTLNSFINYQQNVMAEFTSSASTSTGFIPINVSLEMTGMSGMKIYQEFTVDTKYLPSNYDREMTFLIKGINHTIQNNKWKTTIESLSLPKITNKPLPFNAGGIPIILETQDFDQVAIKRAYQVFRIAGYTNEQIAGLIGNFILESGMKPLATRGGDTLGIAQWLGYRKEQLENFELVPLSINGKDYTRLNTQLYFVLYELNGVEGAAKRELKKVTTTGIPGVVQAAKVVEAKYERSNVQGLAQRIGYALDIYLKIGEGVYN